MPLEPHHDDIPAGAARPRFIGAALAREGPDPRESYASSSLNSYPINDDFNSSVYALNEQRPASKDPSGFYSAYRDDPNEPGYGSTANFGKSPGTFTESPYLAEKRNTYAAPRSKSRRGLIIGGVVVVLLVLAGAGLGVYFGIVKPKNDKDASGKASNDNNSPASPSATGKPTGTLAVVTGGDGSKVTMDDGTTFTYTNKFGGYWYWDPNDPFNNGARAQAGTPALNETFNYGVDIIRG